MLTKATVKQEIAALGVQPDDTVLIHTSLKAIGEIEGGADALIATSWLSSLIVILRQWALQKSFEIDASGISCTFVTAIVLSLWFALPIKHIPWEAVTEIKRDQAGRLLLSIDPTTVQAPRFSKLFLRFGYVFPLYAGDFGSDELEALVHRYCRHLSS